MFFLTSVIPSSLKYVLRNTKNNSISPHGLVLQLLEMNDHIKLANFVYTLLEVEMTWPCLTMVDLIEAQGFSGQVLLF